MTYPGKGDTWLVVRELDRHATPTGFEARVAADQVVSVVKGNQPLEKKSKRIKT